MQLEETFLFQRGRIYHLEYHDLEVCLRRITTRCSNKNDALAFLIKFPIRYPTNKIKLPKTTKEASFYITENELMENII
jgi:hypothetical protein